MHHQAFITINKYAADTNQDAISSVDSFLIEEGFCSSGFFSSGPADWFVIGGEYQSILTLSTIPGYRDFKEVFCQNANLLNLSSSTERTLLFIGKFCEAFPKEADMLVKISETDKIETLAERDAAIVTREIYDNILKEYERGYTDGINFWDIDADYVNESFIGEKWIVVINYHT